jgi:hypothetical protein
MYKKEKEKKTTVNAPLGSGSSSEGGPKKNSEMAADAVPMSVFPWDVKLEQ